MRRAHQAAFVFATAEEFDHRAREVVTSTSQRLNGRTFHVRMHRRGLHYALSRLGLVHDFLHDVDVLLHVPAGAVPKDGPSAGGATIAALTSLLTGRPVRPFVGVTGEITLSGTIVPVGGIREKMLATRRSGVRELVLPAKNEPDVCEVPAELKLGLERRFVQSVEELLDVVLIADRPRHRQRRKPTARRARRQPSNRHAPPDPRIHTASAQTKRFSLDAHGDALCLPEHQ